MNPLPPSLRDLVEGLEFLFETEASKSNCGLLQMINPIIKLVSVFILIFASLYVLSPIPLLALCAIPISLAMLSKIPMRLFLLRSTIFIPIFAGIISIPVIFLTNGQPMVAFVIGPLSLIATQEGLLKFTIFTGRVWFSVASLMLLTMTMGIGEILSALSSLRAPPIFVQMVTLTYRYLILSILGVQKMLFAREARTFIRQRHINMADLMNFGSILAMLFVRTYERSERVYLAMKARGFDAYNLAPARRGKITIFDVSFISLLCLLICFIAFGHLV